MTTLEGLDLFNKSDNHNENWFIMFDKNDTQFEYT